MSRLRLCEILKNSHKQVKSDDTELKKNAPNNGCYGEKFLATVAMLTGS